MTITPSKNRKDHSGKKFGRWSVIQFSHIGKNYKVFYDCECECGSKKKITGNSLVTGASLSCGCLKKEKVSEWWKNNPDKRFRLPDGEANFNATFDNYARQAVSRGLNFELSKDSFKKLVLQECFYCGQQPSNVTKKRGNIGEFIYSGIDRKDNGIGYTVENCVPCCKECNFMKKDLGYNEFLQWIERVAKKCHILQ